MEEKERFEYYLAQNQLYDKTNDELYCFGIEQDKTRLVDFLNLMNEDWWALYIRNKELREENQQLKQQLAEKEEINKLVNEQLEDMERSKLAWENKYFKLEKQLVDKDKEIEYFKRQARRFNNEAQKYYEDAYCNDFHNQDKISFAVEQLEKLKAELHIIHTNGYLKAIDEEIDNQINGLKGEK